MADNNSYGGQQSLCWTMIIMLDNDDYGGQWSLWQKAVEVG